MDVLAGVGGFGESLWSYLIPFLFVLTVVVFFHELGHFSVARWFGVKVDTFSIGFGREIFGWNDKHGTRWKLSWVPLGGYVKFAGDENAASVPDRERLENLPEDQKAGLFHFKPLPQRAAVVAAGPVANFILAIVIFAGVFTFVGRTVGAPLVEAVVEGSPAAAAGFVPGDRIVAIDGERVESFEEIRRYVTTSAGSAMTFLVERGAREVSLTAAPEIQEITDRFGNVHRIPQLGIQQGGGSEIIRSDPLSAVWLGVKETAFIVERTFDYLGGIITGRESADQLRGVIGIAQTSGQVATFGFVALLTMTALLSVSIGLLNLFPVPLLDGGHLLYYAVEAVRGRPLGEQAQEFGFRIGLALVMTLMIFATWTDLARLEVFSFLGGLFS
ncbi:RIP metalloprotease RseP [Parvibaculum sp.]|uniref:RIP metalloprotease RseP n=1 Tax=Parvibaculum sp. TaxID=2024848 RepID=UPI0032F02AB4